MEYEDVQQETMVEEDDMQLLSTHIILRKPLASYVSYSNLF